MAVDWQKPLVTNKGKPAWVEEGPDSDCEYRVSADFGDGSDWWFTNDGMFSGGRENHTIRNATPAEVLVHPDVWPEWQAWAELEDARSKVTLTPITKDGFSNEQPEGVWVTREMLVRLYGSMLGNRTADELGIPPDPPKVAPWEEAYRKWGYANEENATPWKAWKAGVMFAMEQVEGLRDEDSDYMSYRLIRNRIMGEQK